MNDKTNVIALNGKMVLPGLHDVHIHPLGIVQPDVCDLESQPISLDDLVPFLQECIKHYNIADGEWLVVPQWNFAIGNQPSKTNPTLRVALDAASNRHPILLRGNDGHHAAANTLALANVSDSNGNKVGLSKATLAKQFSDYKELVATDNNGEPSGGLTESAIALTGAPGFFDQVDPKKIMPEIAKVLAKSGITSILDAATHPDQLPLYRELEDSGKMTFRMRAALIKDFDVPADQRVQLEDIPDVIAEFKALRDEISKSSELISADAAKIFIDGVIEGNPLTQPPTMPNAAVLKPYLQPVFDIENAEVSGYVDPSSTACQQVKDKAALEGETLQHFLSTNGFHPGQCVVSRGVLEHDKEFINAYMTALSDAGFTIHAHAIGDRAVRVAVDVFESIKSNNGSKLPHSIDHAQLVHPDEQKRIGDLGLIVTFTHAWSYPELMYDLSIIPFIESLKSAADIYNPDSYFMKNVYPTKSILNAGGIIAAGSDAPVDSRDPRPFTNIEIAVTRTETVSNGVIMGKHQRLSIHEAIAAYTVNGAIALSQENMTGTIEVGKKADLIVLDQNIVELANNNQAEKISDTNVIVTFFNGQKVFENK
jgi:predicted amidohydrolase YtcJ